jgi:hypothetical protein
MARVGGLVDVGEGGSRRADGQHVAGAHRGRPDPGQRVRRARAEHRRDVDAATHGEVGAQARGRHPQGEHRAVGEVDEAGVPDRAIVDAGWSRGAGQRDGEAAAGPHAQAAEQHLEGREVFVVPDEAGAQSVCRAVGGAGVADSDAGVAGSALVLDEHERAGFQDLESRDHRDASMSTKRTRVPGVSTAGGLRSGSQRTASVVPMSCHPPGEARG